MDGKGPGLHFWLGQVKQSEATLEVRPSPLCTRRAEHFFEALTEFPGPDAFFGQGPQPPLGACSSAPNICSFTPKVVRRCHRRKRPRRHGDTCWPGQVKQSGSKVQFGPSRSTRHRAERLLSGVVAETGTCSSLPKSCLMKPRQAR